MQEKEQLIKHLEDAIKSGEDYLQQLDKQIENYTNEINKMKEAKGKIQVQIDAFKDMLKWVKKQK